MPLEKFASDVNRYIRRSAEKKHPRSNDDDDDDDFTCQVCKKEFVDPRVLPCLHTFCLECLQKLDLEQNPRATTTTATTTVKRSRNERFQGILGGYFTKDNFTKNEYVRLNQSDERNTCERNNGSHYGSIRFPQSTVQARLKCPTCDFENRIPLKGVQDLPPHYLLQHRMIVDSLNRGDISLLCDLCCSEIPATSRCTTCLLNLCSQCSKHHKRDKPFLDHEVKKLKKNNKDGMGITRIRRQVMCPSHREKELKFYCSSCSMVACTECCVEFHSGHNYECFSKAAHVYVNKIKESLDKIRMINKKTYAAVGHLNVLSQKIESKYSQVQREINNYIDCYKDAFEEHRKGLLKQAANIRGGQLQNLKKQQEEAEKRIRDINHAIDFGQDLLNEGSDFEVLSFAFFILQRLDWCIKAGSSTLSSDFTNFTGTLQFLPDEQAGVVKNKTVFGILTTQVVSPPHCYIMPEGLQALRNCRERQRCDLTLVTKDSYDQQLTRGAEGIEVGLRCQNGLHKQIPICIVDQQNGIYSISFTPDTPGKMCLSISIRGVSIKGSPFPVRVRTQSVHKGTFHCCTFCSSGGNKNAVCGCGGRMPGGYQGCGHGYNGHPGGHHWSCCGNTIQKSECVISFRKNDFYQLRL